jgi:transcriptional regulator with XRE-family HTH domain
MYHSDLATLKDLRTARGATQAQLASRLGIYQPGLSRLEGRSDISMSMLKNFVEALGGKLQITAVFPDTTITLLQPVAGGSRDRFVPRSPH